MPLRNVPSEDRPEFNLTASSTLYHLICVGVACAGLWTIIVATLGV